MSISKKIRKQLDQPDGLTIEKLEPLALEYAEQVGVVNRRLTECLSLLHRGLRSEALQRASIKPNALDLASELNFPELEEWVEILQFYGIDVPELVDRDAIEQLNQAFVQEQPLEELLKQHRRMAIAKAPLDWRLKVLRLISQNDYLNPVWTEDIKEWETARLKQINAEWSRLVSPDASIDEMQKLLSEIDSDQWQQKPPTAWKQKLVLEIQSRQDDSTLDELKSVAKNLYDAYAAGDFSSADELATAWAIVVKRLSKPIPYELQEEVAPALEWVDERRRERELEDRHTDLSNRLEMLLQNGTSSEGELQSTYHDILACQLGIDPLLETRFETRIRELQQKSRRKLTLTLTGVIASTLLLMISAGLWYWNHNYRLAVQATSDRLSQLIESDSFTEAESFLTTVSSQANAVANAPEIVALQANLKSRIEEEKKRHEEVMNLIGLADAEQPESLDPVKIVAAERAAKTAEEKGAIAMIRSRYDQYEQMLVNQDFQALREALQTVESGLERIQSESISNSNLEELERVVVRLKELPNEFPKGAAQGAKLIDLARQRTTSLRESLQRQLRNMELKRTGLVALKNANLISDYDRQIATFISNLPDDSASIEFKEALREKELWYLIEEWNGWCSDLARQVGGTLEKEKATTMLERCNKYLQSIESLPGREWLVKYQEKYRFQETREGIVQGLIEDLKQSIFIELLTLKTSFDKRAFLNHETIPDLANAINKTTNSTLSTIPIIGDPQGSLSNQTIRGKLTLQNNPRQFIRGLVKNLENTSETIHSDWEVQMIKIMMSILDQKELDGSIKELLLSRFVNASAEGSSVMKKIFTPIQEELFRTSESRNRWYVEADLNEVVSAEVSNLFQEAKKQVAATLKEESSEFQSLSRARVVFVGKLLREEDGKIGISLTRADVPEGVLWVIAPKGTNGDNGRLVKIGTVQERIGRLESSENEWLNGRAVFWTRSTANLIKD